ncbi:unnamed protein product [Echinostoma caproni]|uniref:Capsid protein n=1 Tax=Echinostoma caproni TaxID=27848 RepID=A0A183ABZ5_9TREM|nr:unnamed protein product [Echinostoma caproni]
MRYVPNAYVINPVDLENRWRGAKSWMFEAARMEDFAQSELLRQFQSLNGQMTKCGEINWLTSAQLAQYIQLAGEQYKEWLDPRRDRVTLNGWSPRPGRRDPSSMINQTWSTSPADIYYRTIDRTTWNLMENANWLPYLDAVDEYLRKITGYEFIGHSTRLGRIPQSDIKPCTPLSFTEAFSKLISGKRFFSISKKQIE